MKTVTFKNRNRLEVTFTPHDVSWDEKAEGLSYMKMECPDSLYWRSGSKDPFGISFVDPEGGPFVAVGDNLEKHHHPDLPNMVVKAIERSDHGIYLTLEKPPEVQLP